MTFGPTAAIARALIVSIVGTESARPGARMAGPPSDESPIEGSGLSEVVRIRPFRRLWLVLGLSALGDWLGLLATAAFASAQVAAPAAKGLAFGSVIAVQLLPALLLGPVAGIVADRFDRRYTMVAVDVVRFVLFASIPVAGLLLDQAVLVVSWAAMAMFLVQSAAMLWMPAKEAAVPNLLPGSRLETANQLTLVTTYGITPVLAALVFAGLSRLPRLAGRLDPTDVALLFNGLTFLASALVVFFGIKEISGRGVRRRMQQPRPGLLQEFVAGGRYILGVRLVRGLVVGVLGAFAGAGVVVGTAKFYAQSLGGGDATFGILFAALFAGFGLGIVAGPRLVGPLSRRRWFALSVMLAGVAVAVLAAVPRLSSAAVAAVVVGAGAGMAFLAGITLLGREVADHLRGRVFAFVQTAVRAVLMLSIATASVLVGLGSSRRLRLGGVVLDVSTSRLLLLAAGTCGVLVGVAALRQMDDRPGVSVLADLWAALRRRPLDAPRGLYVVIDGPDAAVVAARASGLAAWLHESGRDVVLTSAPPDTRAIRPAVAGGAVVISDQRSSPGHRPEHRASLGGLASLSGWPARALPPDLLILIGGDQTEPTGSADTASIRRCMILDGGPDPEAVTAQIRACVADMVGIPVRT